MRAGNMYDDGPVFPQEVFDLIIDCLSYDRQALCTCALVSSAFLHSARVHIFAHLRVGPLGSIAELHLLLAKYPELPGRVQSLHLRDSTLRRHSWMEEHPPSLTPHAALVPFVSLKTLSITIEWGFMQWTNISDSLRASIRHTLSLSTLTCLELTGLCGLSLLFFTNCVMLKDLRLKSVSFDELIPQVETMSPIYLERLDLDLDLRMFGLFLWWHLSPLSPLNISRLTSLAFTLERPADDETMLVRLFESCAAHLEHLHLRNVHTSRLSLQSLARLRTLYLDAFDTLEPCVRWLRKDALLPPHPVRVDINMVLRGVHPDRAMLAAADAALAPLPSVAGVTLRLLPLAHIEDRDGATGRRAPRSWEREQGGAAALINVSEAFSHLMPLLAGRGPTPLRVFRLR